MCLYLLSNFSLSGVFKTENSPLHLTALPPSFDRPNDIWWAHAVAQLVEALRCKPEGRGFDSRWYHWNFFIDNPSCRTMALELTQPLIEMSTRNISWGVKAAGA